MASQVIVVCRPDQVREAAIVLSCVPKAAQTPLVVLEPPPVSADEYRVLYEAYVAVRDARDLVSGGQLGRQEFLAGKLPAPPSNAEVDERAERLGPYRSWVKHNRLVAELLRPLQAQRTVFLFAPQAEEISFIEPLPRSKLSDERIAVLPPTSETVYLLPQGAAGTEGATTYANLADLSPVGWRLFNSAPYDAARAVEVAGESLSSYYSALHVALESGRPLRVAAEAPATSDAASTAAPREAPALVLEPDGEPPREAVLIEVTNQAERLLGVLYACRRRARLVLRDDPDGTAIEAARAALQQRREGEARNAAAQKGIAPASDASDANAAIAAARAFLFAGTPTAALDDLERAVSAAVSDEAVAAVADFPLTVLTSQTPYRFVNKNGASWAAKPIGHVTGDISLLLLTELFASHADGGVGFNLLFDPGYFSTTETKDVLSELQARVSYSLNMAGPAGSSLALLHLSALPLELVFFNTHGGDDVMLFSDMPMPAFKLLQRATLRSRPIVFNNSCLSWVGVGREFVRIGARGYIGTLWSVDAEQAAALAKSAIARMVHDAAPVSASIVRTGVAEIDERAYIFVGTCDTALVDPAEPDVSRAARLRTAALALLTALSDWMDANGVHTSFESVAAVAQVLGASAGVLIDELDRLDATPSLERLDVLLEQLQIVARTSPYSPDDAQLAHDLYERGQRMLDALEALPKEKASRRALLLQYASRAAAGTGNENAAVDLLKKSIAAAEEAGDSTAGQHLELSDVLKTLNDVPGSRAAADQALAVMRKENAPPERLMLALGRLSQISLRQGDLKGAKTYAQEDTRWPSLRTISASRRNSRTTRRGRISACKIPSRRWRRPRSAWSVRASLTTTASSSPLTVS